VTLRGCLAHPGPLDAAATQGLPAIHHLIKVAGPGGAYRCALAVEGFSLRDILARLGVKKQVDDGFDRPLDLFVTVTGHTGQRALLSYSEIFFAADGGPLLADKARLILPHKHDRLEPAGGDPTVILDSAGRDALDLAGCAACHDGTPLITLSVPKGWLLTVPQDGYGARFVEDVAEITVQQVGTRVAADKAAAKGGFVAEPSLVGPDATRTALTWARCCARCCRPAPTRAPPGCW
jgi:hypothetical protein